MTVWTWTDQWVALLGVLCLLWVLRPRLVRGRHTHEWRIAAAKRVIGQLRKLGLRHGAAAQLSYLRSKQVDPFVFEETILSALQQRGLRIERSARYTGDGGVDGVFWLNGHKVLIQAKRYRGHISAAHVENFAMQCRARRLHGMFIHTGRTGAKSRRQRTSMLEIVSGKRLLQLLSGQKLHLFACELPFARRARAMRWLSMRVLP